MYGHTGDGCPGKTKTAVAREHERGPFVASRTGDGVLQSFLGNIHQRESPLYKEWMVAKRGGRLPEKPRKLAQGKNSI